MGHGTKWRIGTEISPGSIPEYNASLVYSTPNTNILIVLIPVLHTPLLNCVRLLLICLILLHLFGGSSGFSHHLLGTYFPPDSW